MYSKPHLLELLRNTKQLNKNTDVFRLLLTQSIDLLNTIPWEGSKFGENPLESLVTTIQFKVLDIFESLVNYHSTLEEAEEISHKCFENVYKENAELLNFRNRGEVIDKLIFSITNSSKVIMFEEFVRLLNVFGIDFPTLYNLSVCRSLLVDFELEDDRSYIYLAYSHANDTQNSKLFTTKEDFEIFLNQLK